MSENALMWTFGFGSCIDYVLMAICFIVRIPLILNAKPVHVAEEHSHTSFEYVRSCPGKRIATQGLK